jgi:hypothetical protein
VYSGSEHPHQAQDPKVLDVKSMNRKNSWGFNYGWRKYWN